METGSQKAGRRKGEGKAAVKCRFLDLQPRGNRRIGKSIYWDMVYAGPAIDWPHNGTLAKR